MTTSPEQRLIQRWALISMRKLFKAHLASQRKMELMVERDLWRDEPHLNATLNDDTLTVYVSDEVVMSLNKEEDRYRFYEMVEIFTPIIDRGK